MRRRQDWRAGSFGSVHSATASPPSTYAAASRTVGCVRDTISYSKERPAVTSDTDAEWAKNRRAVVVSKTN
jgi:hypothetical protein